MVCIGITETQGLVPDREKTRNPATTKVITGMQQNYPRQPKTKTELNMTIPKGLKLSVQRDNKIYQKSQTYQHHNQPTDDKPHFTGTLGYQCTKAHQQQGQTKTGYNHSSKNQHKTSQHDTRGTLLHWYHKVSGWHSVVVGQGVEVRDGGGASP
jgi:hypothetical protein